MKTVNIGFVGIGYWGKNIFRTFCNIPQVNLLYACDLDEANLSYAKTLSPKSKLTQNYQEILNDPKVDGVVIATPAPTHYELGKQALNAQKNTIVEKPLALNIKEGEELVQLAKKNKLVLMVGHLLKHHAVTHYLKKLIQEGELGDINYIYCQRINLGIIRSHENPLWSLSPHDISLILYFLDEMPVRLSASGGRFIQEGLEDVVFAGLQFPKGQIAHLHLSWLDPHKIRKITIVGSKKMAVFNDMEPREKLRIYDKGAERKPSAQTPGNFYGIREGDIYIPRIENQEPLLLECQNFTQCILGTEKPRSGGEEAVRILKVISRLDESLHNQGVMLPLN